MAKVEYDAYASGIRRIEIHALIEPITFYLKIQYLFVVPEMADWFPRMLSLYYEARSSSKNLNIERHFRGTMPEWIRDKDNKEIRLWNKETVHMYKIFHQPPQEWKEWNPNLTIKN